MDWGMSTAARTLAQEVRGEPPEGQLAVAWVLKNRLTSGRWGHTLASVCLWHAGFSGWFSPRKVAGKSVRDPNFEYACGLRDEDPVVLKMAKTMQDAMDSGTDPTNGATHYCNLDLARPDWIDGDKARGIPPATFCAKIGHHSFYRNVK